MWTVYDFILLASLSSTIVTRFTVLVLKAELRLEVHHMRCTASSRWFRRLSFFSWVQISSFILLRMIAEQEGHVAIEELNVEYAISFRLLQPP